MQYSQQYMHVASHIELFSVELITTASGTNTRGR